MLVHRKIKRIFKKYFLFIKQWHSEESTVERNVLFLYEIYESITIMF